MPDESFFENCAFVCVDIQEGSREYMTELPKLWKEMGFTLEDCNAAADYLFDVAKPNTRKVADACRELSMPMIFVHWGHLFDDGMDLDPEVRKLFVNEAGGEPQTWPHHISSPTVRPAESLGVRESDYVIPKTAQDAFISSNIGFVLRNLGVKNIVFVGGHTGACLGKTAKHARELGYKTVCVEDATFDARESARIPNIEAYGYDYVVTTEEFLALFRKVRQGQGAKVLRSESLPEKDVPCLSRFNHIGEKRDAIQIAVQQNCVAEIRFRSATTYADPFNEVNLDVLFRGPDGVTLRVPAYWAGDNVWVVRFAGERAGEYSFETVCSKTGDTGLHGRSGTATVEPYAGDNQLLLHGRLRVAEDKRHFVHADGTPFFWLGDTWWMSLTERMDWPQGFTMLAADRVAKGFNVIQIVAGPLPDMEAWDPRGRNEGGFPFREGFASVNPAFFDQADLKLGHLVESGLMPCIVGMWGYYLPEIGVEKVKRFWRYIVARYGAFPVVWCIAGEGTMPYYLSKTREEDAAFQRRGWTEVAAHVRKVDAFGNLVTIHPTRYGREMVEDPSLLDFEMLQTSHGDLESVSTAAKSVIKSVGREPLMPVVNAEVNYEGIMGRCWENIQRLSFYVSVFNGTAGHTYGANGIWQVNTKERPYGPSPHGACWGNTPWQEAAQLPGSTQVGLGGRFWARLPWWELEKHPEWVDTQGDETQPYAVRCIGIPRQLRLIYVPLLGRCPTVEHIEPDVEYRAYYFDPCTGAEHDLGRVVPDAEGKWRSPLPPEMHDWVIVLEATDA
jgi:nicotinamidase-related amidase